MTATILSSKHNWINCLANIRRRNWNSAASELLKRGGGDCGADRSRSFLFHLIDTESRERCIWSTSSPLPFKRAVLPLKLQHGMTALKTGWTSDTDWYISTRGTHYLDTSSCCKICVLRLYRVVQVQVDFVPEIEVFILYMMVDRCDSKKRKGSLNQHVSGVKSSWTVLYASKWKRLSRIDICSSFCLSLHAHLYFHKLQLLLLVRHIFRLRAQYSTSKDGER